MKVCKLIFGLLMVLVLVSGSAAFAQEVEPPERGEPPEGWLSPYDPDEYEIPFDELDQVIEGDLEQLAAEKLSEMERMGLLTTLPLMDDGEPPELGDDASYPELDHQVSIEQQDEKEGELHVTVDSELQAINPVTGKIWVASSSAIDYGPPAVAFGGNHYMVVYESNGNIMAKVYNTSGQLQATHTVADFIKDCSRPAVAYQSTKGLFVVVYQYAWSDSDEDIRAQLVHPTESNVGGSLFIASSNYNEVNPSIACRKTPNCLVAYQHAGEARIKGRFITVGTTGLTSWSTIRDLSTETMVYRPKLTWGRDTGFYMLTYNWLVTSLPPSIHARYTKVYDTPQDPGWGQHAHDSEYVESQTPNTRNPYPAYDPCTDKFVIAYERYWGGPDDWDIYAVAKTSGWQPTGFTPFSVAGSLANEKTPAISFNRWDNWSPICGEMNKLVVTYRDVDRGIMAAELRGNSSPTNPIYQRDLTINHFVVDSNSSTIDQRSPVISTGSHLAEMFIAYQEYFVDWGDHDIRGRIVEVMEYRNLSVEKTGTGDGDIVSLEGIDCGNICEISLPYKSGDLLGAHAADGSVFTGWSGDGVNMLWNTRIVQMEFDQHVIANFELAHTLSVNKTGTGDGTVTSNPSGINCGNTCQADFEVDTTVTLTAIALDGSEFTGWSGACSGTGTCQVTMSQARSVTVNFEEIAEGFEVFLPLIIR